MLKRVGTHQRHEKPVVQGASKDNTASEDDAPPPLEVWHVDQTMDRGAQSSFQNLSSKSNSNITWNLSNTKFWNLTATY